MLTCKHADPIIDFVTVVGVLEAVHSFEVFVVVGEDGFILEFYG